VISPGSKLTLTGELSVVGGLFVIAGLSTGV